jgi:hypothetical protein
VVPPPQVSAQTPCEHTCPAAHALPHLPQLSGSFVVLAQTSPHIDCPAGHDGALPSAALAAPSAAPSAPAPPALVAPLPPEHPASPAPTTQRAPTASAQRENEFSVGNPEERIEIFSMVVVLPARRGPDTAQDNKFRIPPTGGPRVKEIR